MEEALRTAVHHVSTVVEGVGAFIIAFGVVVAFLLWAASELRLRRAGYEDVRLMLGRFLALGLEFQLGADILGTAVSPSWNEIGKLGAIAGIRTLLNYFLAQDLRRADAAGRGGVEPHPDVPTGEQRGVAGVRAALAARRT